MALLDTTEILPWTRESMTKFLPVLLEMASITLLMSAWCKFHNFVDCLGFAVDFFCVLVFVIFFDGENSRVKSVAFGKVA